MHRYLYNFFKKLAVILQKDKLNPFIKDILHIIILQHFFSKLAFSRPLEMNSDDCEQENMDKNLSKLRICTPYNWRFVT